MSLSMIINARDIAEIRDFRSILVKKIKSLDKNQLSC